MRKSAYSYALYLLKFSRKSENELRRKLLNKGYSLDEVEKAIQNLKDAGLLNNDEQAMEIVKQKSAKGWSKLKIKHYLYSRGYSSETIENAMDFYDEDAVLNYLKKKLKDYPREKAYLFLKNRGFDNSFINYILRKIHEDG